MKLQGGFLIVTLVVLMSSCADLADEDFSIFSSAYDFSSDIYGWTGDFADYKAKDSLQNDLAYGFSNRPSNIAMYSDQKSLMLSGINTNSNLFMFIKKRVDDLIPNKEYTVVFEVEFGTNTASLAPEDSVYLKVGATTNEPKKVFQNDYYRINIDKGESVEGGGEDMIVIGAVGSSAEYLNDYALVKRSNFSSAKKLISVTANDDGEAWLIVGTDSNYKGPTTIYYTNINVVFSASK